MALEQALRNLGLWAAESDVPRYAHLKDCLSVENGRVTVLDESGLRNEIGILARLGAFGTADVRLDTHLLVWEICRALGIYSASIDGLYQAIGQGDLDRQFTVPAINVRAIAFESARAIFKAMADTRAGAVIFELSRGEIGFTGQRPHEYAISILCAAIAESHRGPVFLQGDHFQISASRYASDPKTEVLALENLIAEAVSAGFFNIDIDTSTLVDLTQSSIDDQQRPNFELSAQFADIVRGLEPQGISISLGGEIGEVGDQNSTVDEVKAYLNGFDLLLQTTGRGLSKLSVQTGTRHGGNVLADGSFGDMPVDFNLIQTLTAACRLPHRLAGSVQHGASMLPLDKIARLPRAGCVEVHLAAAFLNAVYEALPDSHVGEADAWAEMHFAEEWKPEWTRAQFLHHARRYPVGPFKQAWWDAIEAHDAVRQSVHERATAYFAALGVVETMDLVADCISHGPADRLKPVLTELGAEKGIRDLAS